MQNHMQLSKWVISVAGVIIIMWYCWLVNTHIGKIHENLVRENISATYVKELALQNVIQDDDARPFPILRGNASETFPTAFHLLTGKNILSDLQKGGLLHHDFKSLAPRSRYRNQTDVVKARFCPSMPQSAIVQDHRILEDIPSPSQVELRVTCSSRSAALLVLVKNPLHMELVVKVTVGTFTTADLLRTCAGTTDIFFSIFNFSADISSLHDKYAVTIVSNFGDSLDTSLATYSAWSLASHPTITQSPKQLFRAEGASLFRQCSFADRTSQSGRSVCEFLDGRETTQGWLMGASQLPTWTPGSSCALMDSSRCSRLLLVGDSQLRTSFQAMMHQLCSEWRWIDYSNARGGYKGWCTHPEPEVNNPLPRINQSVCGGQFVVWGNGCWSGGASWSSHSCGGKIVYAVRGKVDDERYLAWDFVFAGEQYDVVFVGSELHDLNYAVNARSGPLFTKSFSILRSRHQGPVVSVGSWATWPSLRSKGFAWASSLTKVASLATIMRDNDFVKFDMRRIDLLRLTMPFRNQSPDGVHLSFPSPMAQVARFLWHAAGIMRQGYNSRAPRRSAP